MPAVLWHPLERGPAPPSVLNAVWLMFARVALGLVGIAMEFASIATLRSDVLRRNPSLDSAQVNAAVTIAIIVLVVSTVIFSVLFVLLALQLRKGTPWARTVTLVLISIGLFLSLLTFFRTAPTISHVIITVNSLLDVGIIVLLAQTASARYFNPRA